MPYKDIQEAKKVWKYTVKTIKEGKIVKEVDKQGRRKTYFPKKTQNKVSHVRPHAQTKKDCYPLPLKDQFTKASEYTKHCFWLNASYIKNEIYLK